MQVIYLYMFLNSKFIKNSEYPVCKNCCYYQKDVKFPIDYKLAKCALFGEQDIITGTITNYYVDTVRKNNDQCGIKGKFFDKGPSIDL